MLAHTRSWSRRQRDQHKACIRETWAEGLAYLRSLNKRQCLKTAFGRRFWGWWLLLAAVVAVSSALSIYHNRVVDAIKPFTEKILHTPAAWLVPVVILVIVSVPPLAGHELVILVVGVIWGLWYGFLIAIAGTFIGEIMCYYLFKYFFRAKAVQIEAKSRLYANLANLMRRDGLWMISLVRFSAIPGHVTTAIQSTIGISVWIFGVAAAISLPKQLALVYLGVLFGRSHQLPAEVEAEHGDTAHAAASQRQHTVVSWTVLIVTGLFTVVAAYVIWFRIWQMRKLEAQQISTGSPASSILDGKDATAVYMGEAGVSSPSLAYTLPYYDAHGNGGYTPTLSEASRSVRTLNSHASRPLLGRMRSSTLGSLAASTKTSPYLAYTPTNDLPLHLLPYLDRRPSPAPAPVTPEEGSTSYLGEDKDEMLQLEGLQNAARQRRIRLSRSNSDLLLPSSDIVEKGSRIGGPARARSPSSSLAISSLPQGLGIDAEVKTLRPAAVPSREEISR